jgi:hypothetical protein
MTALVAFAAVPRPALADDVFWIAAGTSSYNTPSNWSLNVVPDAAFNDRAFINNGGTAFLAATAATPTGGVTLGQAPADSGTLEIRNGGNLSSIPGALDEDGSVLVGQQGTGTLRVLSGGTLSATSLFSGGNAASSIVLGGSSGAAATVNISGQMNLARTTRVRRTAAVTAGTLVLQPESNYIAEILSTGFATPMITGTALLDGNLSVQFTGVTPTVGSTYNLLNAGAVAGAFDAIQVTPSATLPLGQKWEVSAVPAGGGRQFAQLKLDEFLVLNVNRGNGQVAITNPGTLSKSIDSYSILSASGSLRPVTWSSLDDQNALGGNWGEANPTVNRLSELKAAGSSTFTGGASQTLGVANSFNPTAFGTDTNNIVFEYTLSDGTLKTGIVNYIGDPNNLLLTVDPTTGEGQLKNTSPFTVAIDSYTIRSTTGSLSPSGWSSLDDQNAGGGNWGEANPTSNRLSELKPFGATTLTPGTAFDLGNLFSIGGAQDLQFEFLFDGETLARQGVVAYGAIPPVGLQGDYNNDGSVDAADYVVWRKTIGTPAAYNVWRSNFGAGAGSGGGGQSSAVPEPATWSISCLASLIVALTRQRGRGTLGR